MASVALSEEQKVFVEDPRLTDGKLYAPPGSGKSLCIIRRHRFLVDSRLVRKNESLIITFTRHACRDLQDRITQYPDHAWYFDVQRQGVQNVRTIDALAYQVMKRWNRSKTDMVQILSPWLLQFLHLPTTTEAMLRQTDLLRHVRILFVDEAQDLNQVQYDIVMRLKEVMNLTVYLVGDPNQSIYGFRGSSPCYLIDFVGQEYHLSYNFRSTPPLVQFTESLKPHKQYVTVAAAELTLSRRPRILHATFEEFGAFLTQFVQDYTADLSTIAILCPTKGNRVRADGRICGLSRVSNLLQECHIPFVQSYQETSRHDEATLYETVPGHVNLLTFHGSKGKEWQTVICMDVWFELMNRVPTLREHADYQYLLYVALTRAQTDLILYLGRERHPSPYLYAIPTALYDGAVEVQPTPKFTTTEDDRLYSITDLIDRMPPELLMTLEPHVRYDSQTRSFYRDYRDVARRIVKNDAVLFGIFLENLFSLQCALHKNHRPRTLRVVETILSGEMIYLSDRHFAALQPVWKACHSWAEYDQIKTALPPAVVLAVKAHFRRTVPWERHFLSCGRFYHILQVQKPYLQQCYDTYGDVAGEVSWEARVPALFYLTLVVYCYNNNHLFNLKDRGQSKMHLLDEALWDLFRDMNQYARIVASKPYQEQVPVKVPYLKVLGKVDLRFVDGTLLETKACQRLLALPNLLQVLLYALADATSYRDLTSRPVMLYNFLTGEVVNVRFTLPETSLLTVFTVLSQASNQPLQRFKGLVHWEAVMGTTGTTSTEAPLPSSSAEPPATTFQPLFLSIKYYKYDWYLVKNQYFQVPAPLSIATTMLTGITDQDLAHGVPWSTVADPLRAFLHQLGPSCALIMFGDVPRRRAALQALDCVPEDVEFLDGKTIAEVYGNELHLTLPRAADLFLKRPTAANSVLPLSAVVDTLHDVLRALCYT